MKKRFLFLIILLAFPLVLVKAATTPRVLTLDATASGSTINYNGTIEPGSTAVMCKLYDSADAELDLLSSPVSNNSFEGSFVVSKTGTYTIRCAHYDGGDVKEVTVGATSGTADSTESSSTATATNPKTYDKGIKGDMILFAFSSLGILVSSIYLKKKRLA